MKSQQNNSLSKDLLNCGKNEQKQNIPLNSYNNSTKKETNYKRGRKMNKLKINTSISRQELFNMFMILDKMKRCYPTGGDYDNLLQQFIESGCATINLKNGQTEIIDYKKMSILLDKIWDNLIWNYGNK